MNEEDFEEKSDHTFDPIRVLEKSGELYKSSYRILIPFGLMFGIIDELGSIFLQKITTDMQIFLLSKLMVNALLLSPVTIALIGATSNLYKNQTVTIGESFVSVWRKLFLFIATDVSKTILIVAGFLLLIFPGIYFAAIFSFVNIIVVLEEKKFRAAFSESSQMARSALGRVILFYVIVVMIFLMPFALIQLIKSTQPQLAHILETLFSVMFFPFMILAEVVMYHSIKETNPYA